MYQDDELDLARDMAEWMGEAPVPDDWQPGEDVALPETRDPAAADLLLRRLALVEAESARIQAFADRQVAMMTEWARDRLAGLDRRHEWWTRQLEGWARANWSDTDRGHTWKLPHGEVKLRKGAERIQVDQECAGAVEALLPAVVERTPKVQGAAVKKLAVTGPAVGPPDAEGYEPRQAMTSDGEAIPGVVLLVPTRLAFSTRPASERQEVDSDE